MVKCVFVVVQKPARALAPAGRRHRRRCSTRTCRSRSKTSRAPSTSAPAGRCTCASLTRRRSPDRGTNNLPLAVEVLNSNTQKSPPSEVSISSCSSVGPTHNMHDLTFNEAFLTVAFHAFLSSTMKASILEISWFSDVDKTFDVVMLHGIMMNL